MAKDLAIVLNNGGVNSAVVTAMAAQKFRPILLCAEAGGSEVTRLRKAYEQQVEYFKPYREHTLAIPWQLTLTNPAAPVAGAAGEARPIQQQLLELTPLIGIAVRFAAFYQASAVYLGLRVGPEAEDLAAATEYGQIWNEMQQLPCKLGELELRMPVLELEAWQVVDAGYQVAAPFDRTWSCLNQEDEPCWNCRGCRQREEAFQQAGRPDPLRMKVPANRK
ncbi:MAG: 7-cyano-7-deazaguanine synthase [Phycisphaerales bacterium]|nr:7-cyano-7-deazaguanine synthase [Phycisphaerales bacterium]